MGLFVTGATPFERTGTGLVPRRPHSPPFKGGVAAQRPGWLIKGREASFDSPEGRSFQNSFMLSLFSVIDIHSHILPEIDDGARSVEEAVEMARIATEDGIEYMVSTPHMFNGLSANPTPSKILERVAALNEAIK